MPETKKNPTAKTVDAAKDAGQTPAKAATPAPTPPKAATPDPTASKGEVKNVSAKGDNPNGAGQQLLEAMARFVGCHSAGSGPDGESLFDVLDERAAELFAQAAWKHEVNTLIENAFQGVLPQLVKRLQRMIDEKVQQAPAAGGNVEGASAASVDVKSLMASDEMKTLLDEKFRHMLLYMKQDVIPKAIERQLTDKNAKKAVAG